MALTMQYNCLITTKTVLLPFITKDLKYRFTDLTREVVLWLKLRLLLI